MNNKNFKVFYFTLFAFLLYFALSITLSISDFKLLNFERVNLFSEVYQPQRKRFASTTKLHFSEPDVQDATNLPETPVAKQFNLYEKAQLITNFGSEQRTSLPAFHAKLHRLKKGEEVKIRTGYFGDSMIEGDLLTQTLRDLLQKEYGGSGVGYLPIYSKVASFRQTASVESSNLNDHNFMEKGIQNPYLSGHYFTGSGTASYTDNTIGDASLI